MKRARTLLPVPVSPTRRIGRGKEAKRLASVTALTIAPEQAITAVAAARSTVVSARQLLYRIGTVYVDMELGRETNSDRASLLGQMLDSSRPGHPLAGVPVVLLNRGRSMASTSSNDNGEFQLEFAMKRDLKLAVEVNSDGPVYLPIVIPQPKPRLFHS